MHFGILPLYTAVPTSKNQYKPIKSDSEIISFIVPDSKKVYLR